MTLDAGFLTEWAHAVLEHFDNHITDPTEDPS